MKHQQRPVATMEHTTSNVAYCFFPRSKLSRAWGGTSEMVEDGGSCEENLHLLSKTHAFGCVSIIKRAIILGNSLPPCLGCVASNPPRIGCFIESEERPKKNGAKNSGFPVNDFRNMNQSIMSSGFGETPQEFPCFFPIIMAIIIRTYHIVGESPTISYQLHN